MNTTKSIEQIAAHFRKTNDKARSKVFQYSAKQVNLEIHRQQVIEFIRIESRKPFNLREQLQARIKKRLQKLAEAMPSLAYTHGSYYHIYFTKISGTYNDTDGKTIYGGYSVKNGNDTITLTLQELCNARVIGGLLTIVGEQVAPKVYACKVRRRRTLYGASQWDDCFLTSNYHGESIDDCQVWRTLQANMLLKDRFFKKHSERFAQKVEQAKKMFYGFEHSLQAGNCDLGTNQFCQDHNLNPEFGYSGEFLLQVSNGRTSFVERMINRRAQTL